MSEMNFRPTRLEISRGALRNNFREIRCFLKGKTRMMAVVKADAYGHGAVETAKIALEEGADQLAVALVEEGIELRNAGITVPILVLGGAPEEGVGAAVAYNIALALYSKESLYAMQREAEKRDTVAHAHVKIDTGMSRVGVLPGGELDDLIKEMKNCPRVKCEGAFTHFCVADSDNDFTRLQNARFNSALEKLQTAGYHPIAHAAASEALLKDETLWHDMVRPGIVQYGCQVRSALPGIRPAQRLVTRPIRLMWIEAGDTVGYGRTFTAKRRTLVATLPIGYGDGYPRVLSNKAPALVRGKIVPIIGRVCMDMIMADVTDVPEITLRDEVVLMGSQGENCITPDQLAALAGTIPYEIILGFGARVPKVYTE